MVNKVRSTRKNRKFGLKKLEKIYRVPNSTISRWVRDINIHSKAFANARMIEQKNKAQYQKDFKSIQITPRFTRLLCSLLYWCEGSKYPSSNTLTFSNSDEKLVRAFLLLLRKGFKINKDKLRVHLQIHTTQNFATLREYWSKFLKIPKSQFYPPAITKPTRKMKRTLYRGTCTIKYFDVKLLLGVMGIYENYGNELEKTWRSGRAA